MRLSSRPHPLGAARPCAHLPADAQKGPGRDEGSPGPGPEPRAPGRGFIADLGGGAASPAARVSCSDPAAGSRAEAAEGMVPGLAEGKAPGGETSGREPAVSRVRVPGTNSPPCPKALPPAG